ncbi:MAG: 2-amino-4-hydroxy-6-hydroxymethyldihydropteridine diphosphokinase [Alphaproteobacteria bacterium]|nr:2-amino-4-hydroxy-6-hydroxymethyldihydropteridine diphosphokinase [Alphaproteobacteria bacterium]
MILIGLGANLPSQRFGAPLNTLKAALEELDSCGVHVIKLSRWYSSAALPQSAQPRYVNAVASVETALSPEALLEMLHRIEHEYGRLRSETNAARVIDLDLLAYGDVVRSDIPPILPHPRMVERAFVLRPICDIDATWRHPLLGQSAFQLAAVVDDADLYILEEANI